MNRSYYKYDFTSPEPIYAKIREELRSYFSTGALDDILFDTWTDHCIRHIGKASLPIYDYMIDIEDFQGKLPTGFIKAREVWACGNSTSLVYKSPSSTYTELSTRVTPEGDNRCVNTCEFPEEIKIVYKTNTQETRNFYKQFFLIPGNISTKDYCADSCFNIPSNYQTDTFDIHGNKIVVRFREGSIYIVYYALSEDSEGNLQIPDDYRIQEYVEAYIKYKLFEQLSNQITDETYNQVMQKMQFYKMQSEEAYIMMNVNNKKKTIEDKFRDINRTKRRNSQYIIS